MDDTPFGDDSLHEECGVFGIFKRTDAAALTTLGLHALQHRGQEAAGIVSFDGSQFHVERHAGLIGDTFTKQAVLERLPGSSAIGHTRYATTGGGGLRNVQPFFAELSAGGFAVAHNGNITNAMTVQRELQRRGSIFSSTSDTETILHLVATSAARLFVEKLVDALTRLEGAFSLVGLSSKKMVGVRDPLGIRPLVLGDLEGSPILASETCALDIIGADFVRDIEPGEMVVISDDGIESIFPFQARRARFCIFEYVYFARPDSTVEGRNVYEIRKKIGGELARESHPEADLVVPVPDSGVPAAIGYAQESNLPFELGIIRNHYVGRTFIQPTDSIRHMGVKLKHNANRRMLEGKRVILVDDSIVRGTTSQKIVQMVREAGATEVHMRIASPPTRASCFYGVDTPEKAKLLASRMTVEEMADFIKVDSLAFLSIDGLYRATDEPSRNKMAPQFCDACFTGDYPTSLTDQEGVENVRPLTLLGGAG
ncbi:amidophosphoribosyltransferase [Aurantimonas manganoxydans SI85-9A1]|jgi:amidophosphoribosyltransferase|uniref:Amidophosphoribosyltransferase n=3 Tax=Aurantimonas TaxID=182269 RepID=Q1YIF9_AURMS|nr:MULTISPECIES: amidophosphoribosyltransferase [Aurantimonas]MCW7544938.1 amidophosphoribosyltransferase [Aurantimonas litoralis]EAS50158.1 amidophosphoribosyltransferase [Aurantimonas manganoxydans SI85-9A1]MBC6717727.1 amidophosphoribosyltransferase [Aurantimonas sp. DM33-3]MCC4299422.1 amidophosphoribosyltransferase [Aurantimonas coralicida]MCD1644190.1 amidophosphoribosyltransferase [Aurantimonas coralicida]